MQLIKFTNNTKKITGFLKGMLAAAPSPLPPPEPVLPPDGVGQALGAGGGLRLQGPHRQLAQVWMRGWGGGAVGAEIEGRGVRLSNFRET